MTVYGSLPGVLTVSYFITSTERACEFLDNNVSQIVQREAQTLFDGLEAYFSALSEGGGNKGGGGKGGNR